MSERLKRGTGKKVLLFQPNGNRLQELKVTKETELAVIAENTDGSEYRVYKHAPAWNCEKDVKFLAVEGEPVTAYIDATEESTWVTIKEFLEKIWTKDILDNLPETLKLPLEAKWLSQITVVPTEINKDAYDTLGILRADLLLHDANVEMFNDAAAATEKENKVDNIVDFLIKAALGAFAMYFLVKQGII